MRARKGRGETTRGVHRAHQKLAKHPSIPLITKFSYVLGIREQAGEPYTAMSAPDMAPNGDGNDV